MNKFIVKSFQSSFRRFNLLTCTAHRFRLVSNGLHVSNWCLRFRLNSTCLRKQDIWYIVATGVSREKSLLTKQACISQELKLISASIGSGTARAIKESRKLEQGCSCIQRTVRYTVLSMPACRLCITEYQVIIQYEYTYCQYCKHH